MRFLKSIAKMLQLIPAVTWSNEQYCCARPPSCQAGRCACSGSHLPWPTGAIGAVLWKSFCGSLSLSPPTTPALSLSPCPSPCRGGGSSRRPSAPTAAAQTRAPLCSKVSGVFHIDPEFKISDSFESIALQATGTRN